MSLYVCYGLFAAYLVAYATWGEPDRKVLPRCTCNGDLRSFTCPIHGGRIRAGERGTDG